MAAVSRPGGAFGGVEIIRGCFGVGDAGRRVLGSPRFSPIVSSREGINPHKSLLLILSADRWFLGCGCVFLRPRRGMGVPPS